MGLLSVLILAPLVGALVLALARGLSDESVRRLSFGLAVVVFLGSLTLLGQLPAFESTADYQFVEDMNSIPGLNIRYHLGIDGLSLWLIIQSTFLTPIAMLGSWTSVEERVKEFNIFLLILESAMIGVFCALDLFL